MANGKKKAKDPSGSKGAPRLRDVNGRSVMVYVRVRSCVVCGVKGYV